MTRFDKTLASPFRMEWLVPLDPTTKDDLTRAVADKAATLVRSAHFLRIHRENEGTDVEVRVWVEAASFGACVSVTFEPGVAAFGFHVLDESLRERLACIVFDALPCVDAEASEAQADLILDAALEALAQAPEDLMEAAERVRHAKKSVRVTVLEGPAFDPGVER